MFKGSIVALITPFKNDKLDTENYLKLINFHIENGTMDCTSWNNRRILL